MFVAVFVALFMLTAASGISAAGSCTTSLPTVAIEGGECPASNHNRDRTECFYFATRGGKLHATRSYS